MSSNDDDDTMMEPAMTRKQRRKQQRRHSFIEKIAETCAPPPPAGVIAEDLVRADIAAASRSSDGRSKAERISRTKLRAADNLQRRVERQYRDGLCVWSSLCKGVLGLHPVLDAEMSPVKLLAWIRSRLASETVIARINSVKFSCNGAQHPSLSAEEVTRCVERLSIGDGYLTTGCDPLLISVCAVFHVSIQHRFDTGAEIALLSFAPAASVSSSQPATRVIRLASSPDHMTHVGNF